MPSRKGMEQALTWLRSKAMDRDSLDGINAELCLNVIADLKRQNESKGVVINQLKRGRLQEEMDNYMRHPFYPFDPDAPETSP